MELTVTLSTGEKGEEMQRPTWATATGMCCVVFGLFGVLGSLQIMTMPGMIATLKGVFTTLAQTGSTPEKQQQLSVFLNMFFGRMPPWFRAACVFLGVAGLLVNGLYTYAGISLLKLKTRSVPLLYCALPLSGLLCVVRYFVIASAMPIFRSSYQGLAGLVIDMVLLIVVVINGREVYERA